MDPHPAIVTIRDNRNYISVLIFLVYHYYKVWGPPIHTVVCADALLSFLKHQPAELGTQTKQLATHVLPFYCTRC